MTENQQTSMYRQAAIDSHYMQKYGSVCMLPRIGHYSLFASIVVLVVMVIVFISTQPFFDTVNVNGWVNTTTSNIEVRSQEAAGIVEQVFVTNGTEIIAGQPIAIVNRSHGTALGQRGIEARRVQIAQTQENRLAIFDQNTLNLIAEAKGLNNQFLQTTKQIEELVRHQHAHKSQVAISKQRWRSVKALAEKGNVTTQQVEQSELQMLTLHQQDFELFMQLQSLQTTQAKISEQSLKNKQQQAQVRHEINLLNINTQQELDTLQSDTQFTINSPRSGLIDNLQINAGESVTFNQVLTQIAPIDPAFFIQLAIPSHQVAFLQENQQVQIKIDGFAYQKYGTLPGIITHISKQVISPNDLAEVPPSANQPVYLVNIDLENLRPNSNIEEIVLRSGMTVKASINKQESTILAWLLAPLIEVISPTFTAKKGP